MEPFTIRKAGSLAVAVLHDADADPVQDGQAGRIFLFGKYAALGSKHAYPSFREAAADLAGKGWTALPLYLRERPGLALSAEPLPGCTARPGRPEPAGLAGMAPEEAGRIWRREGPERRRGALRLLRCEVQDFNDWLQGQAWRFEIHDSRRGLVASAGSFFGDPGRCLEAGLSTARQIVAARMEDRLQAGDGRWLSLDARTVLASAEDPGTRLRAVIAPDRNELAMLLGLAEGFWQSMPGLALRPERLLAKGAAGIVDSLALDDAGLVLGLAADMGKLPAPQGPERFFSREMRACFSASLPAGIQSLRREGRDGSLALAVEAGGLFCAASFPAELLKEALHALDREEARRRALQAGRLGEVQAVQDGPGAEDACTRPESWRDALFCAVEPDPQRRDAPAVAMERREAHLPSGPLSEPGVPQPSQRAESGGAGEPAQGGFPPGLSPGLKAGMPYGFPLAGWIPADAGEEEDMAPGLGCAAAVRLEELYGLAWPEKPGACPVSASCGLAPEAPAGDRPGAVPAGTEGQEKSCPGVQDGFWEPWPASAAAAGEGGPEGPGFRNADGGAREDAGREGPAAGSGAGRRNPAGEGRKAWAEGPDSEDGADLLERGGEPGDCGHAGADPDAESPGEGEEREGPGFF